MGEGKSINKHLLVLAQILDGVLIWMCIMQVYFCKIKWLVANEKGHFSLCSKTDGDGWEGRGLSLTKCV